LCRNDKSAVVVVVIWTCVCCYNNKLLKFKKFKLLGTMSVVQEWMPPSNDREARRRCLDEQGPAEFERIYECRLRSEVYALWMSERHKRFKQKSQEWHDFRNTRLTGSVVPAVLEYKTFQGESRRQKFLSYVGLGTPFVENPACDYGNKYEDAAMCALERVLTTESHRSVFLPFDIIDNRNPAERPWAYSPDGISSDGVLAEAKVPWRRVIVPGVVKPNYDCQQQFGIENIDLPTICEQSYFVEYRPPCNEFMLDTEIVSVTKVSRDPQWLTLNSWLLDEFWAEVKCYREAAASAAGRAVIPDHYRSEAATSVWYKKRVLAEPHRFHKQQRLLFASSRPAAATAANAGAVAGSDIDWTRFVSTASASLASATEQPPQSPKSPKRRKLDGASAGTDIKW
jgi:hypothetical protein